MFLFAGTVHPETVEAKKLSYYIKVNRKQNVVTIYRMNDKGKYTVPVKAMLCSTGAHNSTPTGTFSLKTKYRWHALFGNVYGQYCSRITGRILFHSVCYDSANPSTLDYREYNKLGKQASHGCVRLTVEDVKWIYDHCPSGTKVTIYDGKNPGPLGKPETIKIKASSKCRGWDPTDPAPGNPWHKIKPVFKGLKNRIVERGSEKINLKKGVTATDYRGKKLKFKISGKCDAKKAGKYKITYTAEDAWGNRTQKKITITVEDTTAPDIRLNGETLKITGELPEDELIELLKQNVTADDSGEALSPEYITVEAGELLQAMASQTYGIYTVTVYAEDEYKNQSKVMKFKVEYAKPESVPADEPESVPADELESFTL